MATDDDFVIEGIVAAARDAVRRDKQRQATAARRREARDKAGRMVGYVRVSTEDQGDLGVGLEALTPPPLQLHQRLCRINLAPDAKLHKLRHIQPPAPGLAVRHPPLALTEYVKKRVRSSDLSCRRLSRRPEMSHCMLLKDAPIVLKTPSELGNPSFSDREFLRDLAGPVASGQRCNDFPITTGEGFEPRGKVDAKRGKLGDVGPA